MKKLNIFIFVTTLFCGCNKIQAQEVSEKYMEQIGDTPFETNQDNAEFHFCDSTNVLHKRALISYVGGFKAMEAEIINNYSNKPDYITFSGYFFIRFAVNCKGESDRFRWEIVGEDFKKTVCPYILEKEIIKIVKNLKKWNPANYEGKIYDGYTFIIIKMINGKIVKS
jgi:hypothetical protein